MSRGIEQHALGIAIGASVVLQLFGINLWLDNLLITFLHEASHGLAAILTGGAWVSFQVSPDSSGVAYTVGGFRPLILVAGYAGACFWGGMLLVAARQPALARPVLGALAAFLLLVTLVWARNGFGFVAGLGLGAGVGLAAIRLPRPVAALGLGFLAVRLALNALSDLRTLLMLSPGGTRTDAALMSREFSFGLVPTPVFALAIALVGALCFTLPVLAAWKWGRDGRSRQV